MSDKYYEEITVRRIDADELPPEIRRRIASMGDDIPEDISLKLEDDTYENVKLKLEGVDRRQISEDEVPPQVMRRIRQNAHLYR